MKPTDTDILISYLRECFILRKDGTLIWRKRPREHFATDRAWATWNSRFSGKKAGSPVSSGYILIRMTDEKARKRQLYAHRVIWAMAKGEWPAFEIDHRDGKRAINRLSNLRDAPDSFSQRQNMKCPKTNTSGVMGVSWNRRWFAKIRVHGKQVYLGRFDTLEAAHAAYLAAKQKYHLFQPVPRG